MSFTHQVEVFLFIVLSIVALLFIQLNKQHLETWSCVCGYCTYRLFLCFRSLWNIPKNTRELGIGRRRFPSSVNGLIWPEVLFIEEVSGVYTFWFSYSFAGGFWEALTNDREETGIEINNSRYDSRTYTCVLYVCFEAALEQRTGVVFVLFVEQVHCLHNALKCILLLCVEN